MSRRRDQRPSPRHVTPRRDRTGPTRGAIGGRVRGSAETRTNRLISIIFHPAFFILHSPFSILHSVHFATCLLIGGLQLCIRKSGGGEYDNTMAKQWRGRVEVRACSWENSSLLRLCVDSANSTFVVHHHPFSSSLSSSLFSFFYCNDERQQEHCERHNDDDDDDNNNTERSQTPHPPSFLRCSLRPILHSALSVAHAVRVAHSSSDCVCVHVLISCVGECDALIVPLLYIL